MKTPTVKVQENPLLLDIKKAIHTWDKSHIDLRLSLRKYIDGVGETMAKFEKPYHLLKKVGINNLKEDNMNILYKLIRATHREVILNIRTKDNISYTMLCALPNSNMTEVWEKAKVLKDDDRKYPTTANITDARKVINRRKNGVNQEKELADYISDIDEEDDYYDGGKDFDLETELTNLINWDKDVTKFLFKKCNKKVLKTAINIMDNSNRKEVKELFQQITKKTNN